MRLTIDSIEGDMAVCEKEDRETIRIPKSRLPLAATEGDLLEWQGRTIRLLREETRVRRNEIERLMDDVFEQE
ncbi:DUF3006 domain-containing protein [Exiguobacterium flavidum]|uniref:DUF3006 domain-containing protein n=1 Tax=Exiguobacterium flavidum TaxID=2184695 RepID=UPI001300AFB8|nr:DUF3006 domain-containing protein [Exiguobacterium flavidum]